jgi:predicted nucleotidyltransferase
LNGEIPGFGTESTRFFQYTQHHILDDSTDREYDLCIYSIVKFFQLCMDNNPNIIDSLFVPPRCVLHCTILADEIRSQRRDFLHKECWHRFKGYAFRQLNKIRSKTPKGKRKALVKKFGFDTRFATHVVRLLNEVEQIMIEGDLDLERNREQLKSIRDGHWTLEDIEEYFSMKERSLEELYTKCTLPHSPDEKKVKNLLLHCLEEYYGSLKEAVITESKVESLIHDLKELVHKYENK